MEIEAKTYRAVIINTGETPLGSLYIGNEGFNLLDSIGINLCEHEELIPFGSSVRVEELHMSFGNDDTSLILNLLPQTSSPVVSILDIASRKRPATDAGLNRPLDDKYVVIGLEY